MNRSAIAWILKEASKASPVLFPLSTLASGLLAIVPAIQVLLIAEIISSLSGNGGQTSTMSLLVALGLLAGGTPAIGAVIQNFDARASQKLQARLNCALVTQAARVPPAELINSKVSATIERHSRAIGEGIAWSSRSIISAATSIISAASVIIAVFSFSWVAGLCTILALVPPIIHSVYMAGVWEREWERVSPHYDRERYLRDLVVRQRTATELGAYGTSEAVADLVAKEWLTISTIMGRALRPQTLGSAANGLITSMLLTGAVVSVVVGSHYEAASAAGIYGVLSAISGASSAGMNAGMALELLPQISRLREFIEAPRKSRSSAVREDASVLTAQGLTVQYDSRDRPAITDVSLTVNKGEIIALVGYNGAGKSTVVNAITGLVPRQHGTVRVDSQDIDDVEESQWLANFGILTQEFGRFELTVREAVALGAPAPVPPDEAIWEALEAAQAADFVGQLPDQLDQQLGEQFGGTGVSGGQWQRLALARIHLRQAPIWILVEPTSAIDAESEERVFAELVRTKSDRITIVVSHRSWTLKHMDRIYVIEDGAVTESGSYDELMSRPGPFSTMFAAQHASTGVSSSGVSSSGLSS